MKNDIFKNRIKKISQSLRNSNLDALILTANANITYLSGFGGDDSWLILTAKNIYLITDSRYTLQAKRDCPACKIYVRKGPMLEAVADILKKSSGIKFIGVEDRIELSWFNRLRKELRYRIKPVKSLVESVRQIKDNFEISAIKKAAALAQKALAKVLPKIRIEMSETEIAAMLNFEMQKAGATPAFETIVAFGSNSAMPHHRPTSRKLKKIDTILIDFGAKLNGYCSDITRCFAVGKIDDFYAKVYKVVYEAQKEGIKIIKAGLNAKDADAAAKEIINKSKLPPYGHGLGHGVGLDVHERPVVSFLSKDILQNGDVVTIEPAVYLPGKFGIRIEDDCLITENGCEVLTTLLKSDEVPLLKIKNKK